MERVVKINHKIVFLRNKKVKLKHLFQQLFFVAERVVPVLQISNDYFSRLEFNDGHDLPDISIETVQSRHLVRAQTELEDFQVFRQLTLDHALKIIVRFRKTF